MGEARKILVHGLLPAELAALCGELGQPAFRARQLWQWLYVRRADEWAAMRNIPAALRDALSGRCELHPVSRLGQEGEPSGTRKLLVGLRDGECVEEVLIPSRDRMTVCVSTQVGCRLACAFCASGQAGFIRHLEAGEIVGEALLACREHGDRPSNLVFMGMGEPLDNCDAVLKSIRILNDADGLALGARHITISTSGLIPGIERLAREGLQVELSVSLHAPDSALRDRLMPVNRAYPLADLLAACDRYAQATKRIVTFEYTLIKGVNDSRTQAAALARLLRGRPARVNLIPLSPVAGFDGEAPAPETAAMFVDALERAGVNATVRVSKGGRIEAACGQLRMRRGAAAGGRPPGGAP